jgi:hypothetical protein
MSVIAINRIGYIPLMNDDPNVLMERKREKEK